MVRKFVLAAAAAGAILAGAGEARATPRLFEPYSQIFQARTFLCTPVDARPKDALHAAPSNLEDPRQRFLLSPYFRDDETSFYYGLGLAYGSAKDEWHPWSIAASYLHGDFDSLSVNFDGFEVNAKYVLWQPADVKLPVVSLVGAVFSLGGIGARYDGLLAIDQRINNRTYATANVGWARLDSSLAGTSALATGFGVTYAVNPRLTLSADFIPSNSVEGADRWGLGCIWAINTHSAVKFGGGKDDLLFFNYIAKRDWK